ncbi:hypothetical protein SUS17_3453 [Sphingomonas sp. S17]|nr:hypothetical protein SUS17_3453 [Sphingomonas sp. S17]
MSRTGLHGFPELAHQSLGPGWLGNRSPSLMLTRWIGANLACRQAQRAGQQQWNGHIHAHYHPLLIEPQRGKGGSAPKSVDRHPGSRNAPRLWATPDSFTPSPHCHDFVSVDAVVAHQQPVRDTGLDLVMHMADNAVRQLDYERRHIELEKRTQGRTLLHQLDKRRCINAEASCPIDLYDRVVPRTFGPHQRAKA